MRVNVVYSFLKKKAQPELTKKLAVSILKEIIQICLPLKNRSEHASLLISDASFVLEKINKATDEQEIKRRMNNLRDQVALRSDFMKDEADDLADKQAIYKLDVFTYKTSSISSI